MIRDEWDLLNQRGKKFGPACKILDFQLVPTVPGCSKVVIIDTCYYFCRTESTGYGQTGSEVNQSLENTP